VSGVDLVQWLGVQLDEDERIARGATPGPWSESGVGDYGWGVSFNRDAAGVETDDSEQGRADSAFIAEHDPARVLREIDSKRRMLAIHRPYVPEPDQACLGCADAIMFKWCPIVRLLALPYADRPGYRAEWAPTP
jgi:hypothetical protein